MRAVIQRVSEACVTIDGNVKSKIEVGYLILLGIEQADNKSDIDWLVQKIVNMRLFSDEQGKMNLDIKEMNGEILVVSQFTLHASTKKGNRPSFIKAARPEVAIPLYNLFVSELNTELTTEIKTGEFGANMEVQLVNSGPVTITIDSKNRE